jgi:hypothetical protein
MSGPCDEGDATRRGQPIKSTLDPLEPAIDVALNDFGGVRSQYPKVPRTTGRADKRIGYNKCLLAVGGHLRHTCRTSHDRIPLPATMFLDDSRTPFGVMPRLPRRWLRYHVDPALRVHGQEAEAQKSTKLFHPGVVLPPAPPLGGGDGEPDLVAGGRAINGLKHQFKGEALLHLADDDQFGRVFGKGDEVAAPHLTLDLQAEPLQMNFDWSIEVGFQGRWPLDPDLDQISKSSLTQRGWGAC